MVRQKLRKSVEELYATKLETNAPKHPVHHNPLKNSRNNDHHNFGGSNYIITSKAPMNSAANMPHAPPLEGRGDGRTNPVGPIITNRNRKSARPNQAKIDKIFAKEERSIELENLKKEQNLKARTARTEKRYNSPNRFDNKNVVNFAETSVSKNPYHHHNHYSNMHDDDKDDDTEFFELIRQTVEVAIGKSISELLNRNFRELSTKVDRFSTELKQTNMLLNKLQHDMNSKVVHYGEENSRHFRYLCMKSEYDKMFYQHQTMLASAGHPPQPHVMPMKGPNGAMPKPPNDCGPCSCNSRKTLQTDHKSSSEEHSVSQKSSEMGMREVLDHIQRFCNQMQLNELKCDGSMPKSACFRNKEDPLKIGKQLFDEEDEEDFQMSSDGMTPRSDVEATHKFGGATMRSCGTTRGTNGGGDA